MDDIEVDDMLKWGEIDLKNLPYEQRLETLKDFINKHIFILHTERI